MYRRYSYFTDKYLLQCYKNNQSIIMQSLGYTVDNLIFKKCSHMDTSNLSCVLAHCQQVERHQGILQ